MSFSVSQIFDDLMLRLGYTIENLLKENDRLIVVFFSEFCL